MDSHSLGNGLSDHTLNDNSENDLCPSLSLNQFSEMLNQFIRYAHLAYIELDLDFNVRKWNSASETIWDIREEDAVGKSMTELVFVGENKFAMDCFFSEFVNNPQHMFEILDHQDKNGNDIFCEWFISPIYDKTGRLDGISSIIQNITNRVQTEKELDKIKRYQLKRIFQSAPIGIYQVDIEGIFINVNPELAWMLGYESTGMLKKELKGMEQGFFADEKQRREFFFYIKEAEKVNQFKTQVLRRDGTTFWALLHAQITQNDMGRTDGFYGFLIDISQTVRAESELKKAKDLAESATQAKSDFLANMSHEIRTPLNAIIGFTNLVLKTALEEKQKDYIKKVGISGKALLGIINDILDFSKIEAGKLDLESAEFSLYDILDNLSDMFANIVMEKGIELIISASPNVPGILIGDSLRLSQILINLINNAIKFTHQGEVVVWVSIIEMHDTQVRIQFSISDTGVGMTPDQRTKLFSSFTQADTSTTRKYGGTGLGLSISKRLVDMMGGKIWVKSEAGQGSTFAFTVNLKVGDHSDNLVIQLPESLDNLRILVQDDNPATREVIMMILISYSFKVMAVASEEETLHELERAVKEDHPYEMVIINWQNKDKEQVKTIEKIREWEKENKPSLMPVFDMRGGNNINIKYLPLVITFNFGQEEERRHAEEAGATAFVVKPIKQTVLLNSILNIYGFPPVYKSQAGAGDESDDHILEQIKGALVLLVDDNEINQEVATETLKRQGLIVEIAGNGKIAVDKIQEKGMVKDTNGDLIFPYDVVLMDIQMPEMDGYQATSVIRQWEKENVQDQKRFMPIIAMSAHALSTEMDKCMESGMNDYVSKPIEPKILFSQLAKWVRPANRVLPPSSEPEIADNKKDGQTFPEHLEGVDIQSGLMKVAGNKELYVKLLFMFAQKNTEICHDIKNSMKKGEYDSVKQMVHSIKGASGNLGIDTLCASAGEFEKTVKNMESDRFDSQFELFENNLNTVLSSINRFKASFMNNSGKSMGDSAPGDLERVISLAEHILKNLDDDFNEARQGVEQLKHHLEGTVFNQDYKVIEGYLADYDIDQAMSAVSLLINRLKKSMKREAEPEGSEKKQKVLVVDDVTENIEVLMELLRSDFKMVAAKNGEKALELAYSKPEPDLILLDINMPGMDGFEVCRRLKASEQTKDIPVIFITAESEVQDQTRGFELGAVDYITKPIVPIIVKMRVRTQLELKKQRDLLSRLSTIDGLTGISNRRRFDDILAREWHRCLRNNTNLSVVLMDIDHFKQFNDHYGHQQGDDCLKKVADALTKGPMRETDLVARYGGEEFVAVLPDTNLDGALVVAERMRENLTRQNIPHEYSSAAGYVTVSQGVATMIPTKANAPHDLVEYADQCLYQAKEGGRNKAVSRMILPI